MGTASNHPGPTDLSWCRPAVASRLEFAHFCRLPDGVVRDWLMKNQPDEGSSSALQRRLAVFDNTKQDRFENHLLDVGNRC